MDHSKIGHAVALTLAGAIVFAAATPLGAAPVLVHPAAVKAAVSTDLVDVRYRSRGFGAAVVVGFVGAAIASQQSYGSTNYAPGYDAQSYYGEPTYGPSPDIYAPRYGLAPCAGDERYRRC